MSRERQLSLPVIVCAATVFTYKVGDKTETVTIPAPRHFSKTMHDLLWKIVPGGKDAIVSEVEGFIDQHDRFHDRKEAWLIAEARKQIKNRVGSDGIERLGLFSENLY